ncbi:MAG: hypothetical protein WDZ40_03950 [Candidatus Spechtbacterales bacterium]
MKKDPLKFNINKKPVDTHCLRRFNVLVMCLSVSVFFIAFAVFSFGFTGLAQEEGSATNQKTIEQEKKELQQQLELLQAELNEIQGELNKHSQEAASYERDIAILEAEIRKIRLQQQQTQLVIQQTGVAISTNQQAIEELSEKEEKQKQLLSSIILGLYKMEDTSSVEILLMGDTLSDFFNDIARRRNLQEGLKLTLDDVKEIKADIEEEQREMEAKRDEQSQFLQIQTIQRAQVAEKVDEKENLLDASKSKEYEYREIAEIKQKTIQEVRNQIFRLEGAGIAVTFEEAYDYAKRAGEITGVRPALLLSILKQESSWGANVGQCTLVDETGMGRGVNSGSLIPRIMRADHARNDVQAFLQITQSVGRDPYNTRVSCWPAMCVNNAITTSAKPTIGADGSISCPAHTPYPFGYGGAMGPAQFLPTTWLGYHSRVSSLLGRPADPWLILDAFVASAVKLGDGGARAQTYNSEWCSALIYYSGSCTRNLSVNRFYGDQVMKRAAEYQRDIDILEGR